MTVEELREQVREGWKVRIIDHDYGSEGREDCTISEITPEGFVITPRKPWRNQGNKYTSMQFTWDNGSIREMDPDKPLRLHSYVMGTAITSRSTPGVRRLSKTYVFEPPKGY